MGRPPAVTVCTRSAAKLPVYGTAPEFSGVTRWFNTANGAPLALSQLRGKVVLVDFWTYSCINCLRSLPHVEGWYDRYRDDGFVVVGVHTPEFDFEHVPGNVQSAISRLGIHYPIAMDNDYGTWDAWGNNSWPAEYLIDPDGNVRYGSVGESEYGATEAAIRALLTANGKTRMPAPTEIPDRTPTDRTTPESYLGYERLERYSGSPAPQHDTAATYSLAGSLPPDHVSYGGTWTVGAHQITAGPGATLEINVDASDVYLVLAGNGTVSATLDGQPLPDQHVSGVPELYTLVSGDTVRHGILRISVPQKVKAYDFTFG